MLLPLLLACTGPETDDSTFMLDARLEPLPRATSGGYPADDPEEAYFAAQHVVPGLHWGNSPPTELVIGMWEHLMGENVADPGSCPYGVIDGAEVVWSTECRSQDGYNWSGTATEVTWSEGGQEWTHWTFDLQVDSDVESRTFDRIALDGEYIFGGADRDKGLLSHTEMDLVMEVEGYWDTIGKDRLGAAWAPLALTGMWETQLNGELELYQMKGHLELGDDGGLTFDGQGGLESDGCAVEPRGALALGDDVTLRFEGDNRCDNCAMHSVDGSDPTLACQSTGWL
jgi:hypothetical protein